MLGFNYRILENSVSWGDVWDKLINWCKTEGLKIIIGLVIVLILFKVINLIFNRIRKRLIAKHIDKTVSLVMTNFLKIMVKVLIFIAYLVMVGFDTASLGAILASLGVGIGLAVQGGLSNFAGGVLILFNRPFRLDDYIECEGAQGTVENISLFYTRIKTFDNKQVVIPNSKLISSTVTNYTKNDIRRIDINVQMSYSSKIDDAQEALKQIVANNELILNDPAPNINVSSFDDSGITLLIRIWAKTKDYWDVKFSVQDALKKVFDDHGIDIPFPQVDVHIKNEEE